jgi:rhodanese-related sulfurtransferase
MKTINLFIILFAILLVPGLSAAQTDGVAQIKSVNVPALLADGALFIDVREANEVEALAYDLPGVLNLPLSEFSDRLQELPQDRQIILACRTGKRSTEAAALLTDEGFTQLHHLTGGIVAWETAGLSVRKIDRTVDLTTSTPKQCCSAKGTSKKAAKSCGSAKADGAEAEAEKASCGEKEEGKGKGKSCCAGGGK